MARSEFEDTITTDVGRRLEELFEYQEDTVYEAEEKSGIIDKSDFKNLEAVVFSIDDYLTDTQKDRFRYHLKKLSETLADDKLLMMFLRLLNSLVRFISEHSLEKDQQSLELIGEVYTRFEKVAFATDMNRKEKTKILYDEIEKYKALKVKKSEAEKDQKEGQPLEFLSSEGHQPEAKIGKETVDEKREGEAENQSPSEGRDFLDYQKPGEIPAMNKTQGPGNTELMSPQEAFDFALQEIKKVIQSEFRAIRAELLLWRKGQ